MYEHQEMGELEVMLQNLKEEHSKCPFRFHKELLDDYCDVITREAHGFKKPCVNEDYVIQMKRGDVVFPSCQYFQKTIDLDFEIYKRKKDLTKNSI